MSKLLTGPLPTLSNLAARRLFLERHGLHERPSGTGKGQDLLEVFNTLGFVQVDSVKTVGRAHDMILFSRRSNYREKYLPPLIEKQRYLFEHWTHDASILPMAAFGHWKHRFRRNQAQLADRWRKWGRQGFETQFETILKQIADHGPVGTSDVGETEQRKSGGWWDWNPSKAALEYLWRTGELSISHRVGFQKIYDLTERVIPEDHRLKAYETTDTIDWACTTALAHLGFATPAELAAFYDLITLEDAKAWCTAQLANGSVIEVLIEGCGQHAPRKALSRPETLEVAQKLEAPTSRLRILSPFDPMLRDRKRALRLFNFDYRIEIFVPEPQRKYGYYVFPVLEGDRLVGRIDMKVARAEDSLNVKAFWPERGLSLSAQRLKKLEGELERLMKFAGVSKLQFEKDWSRTAL
ncbi:MAG: winged helix-turn-helix domain-containing protein [Rhodobacteraceae bacterium]|nr:winged helix-turn-helix domain-containing protein [Paracoccaceae bacterium]